MHCFKASTCAPLYKQVVASHPYNSSNIRVYPDLSAHLPPTPSPPMQTHVRCALVGTPVRRSQLTVRWLLSASITKSPFSFIRFSVSMGRDRKLFRVRSDWTNVTATSIQIMSLVVIQNWFFCFSQGYETSKPTLPTITPTLFYEWSSLPIGRAVLYSPAPDVQSVRFYWWEATSVSFIR